MKTKVLIARPLFPEIAEELSQRYALVQGDDELSPADFRRLLQGAQGAITSVFDRVDGALLDACPALRVASNITAGHNNLDLEAMTERGVLATNTAGMLDDTVAELTWALILAAARRVTEAERWMRDGNWKKGWMVETFLGRDLRGGVLGIVGMGGIGRGVARGAAAFGMKVVYHNRKRVERSDEERLDARWVTLEELLRQSDVVCLTLSYSPEAHHLIGAKELALMKPTAIFVNTSRGAAVDEEALLEALIAGRIFSAGIDVFENEPKINAKFMEAPNLVLTPHIGSATRATRLRMMRLAVENLDAALAGRRPPNLLNPEAWDRRRAA